MHLLRRHAVALLLMAALILAAGTVAVRYASAPTPPARVGLTILAINDFHGNLKPPAGGISITNPADKSKKISVPAGGSEYMATLVQQVRSKTKNSVFVAAGDLIGASPLLSGLFHDEPTIESLSLMGLELSAVGNHEFDEGKDELLRMQKGGCHPSAGCKGPTRFAGALFRYLAASTIEKATGRTLFPAYEIKEYDGIPVAFIGLTLKATPDVVKPSGVAGLEFRDEAETINELVPQIRQRGVEAIVVLIHEGGFPTGDINECPGISGRIVEIVKKLDKAVDLVVSGHTHRAYTCVIDGRLVTSGDKYGTLVTQIEVELDPKTRDIVSSKANNLIVRTDSNEKDPKQTRLIAEYEELSRPLAARVVGSISAPLLRAENTAGESALGQIIADAQLAATVTTPNGGAVIAFTNPGGIRTDIQKSASGRVTYADLFAAQPFGNSLITLTLMGAQIKKLLEQQWLDQPKPRILQVSKGFSYAWDDRRPRGDFVAAETITLNGQQVDPSQTYRVTVNDFLADGGDGFFTFKEGAQPTGGPSEIKALEEFFVAKSPLAPGSLDRIRRSY